MCRNNFIFSVIYLSLTFLCGSYLGSIVLDLIVLPVPGFAVFVYFICIAIVALFLLPILDYFTT